MTGVPTLYRAAWVLPVATAPIRRGEVLVGADGRIAAVAPAGVLDLPADIRVHDAGNVVLMPGLVNIHTHPELAVFRGALEDLPFRDWILRLVGARRNALNDEDSLVAATWSMAETLAGGVTTIGATEPTAASIRAMTDAGVRGVVYQEVFGPDPRQADEAMRGLERDLELARSLAGSRVEVGISPHAPYTVSDELYARVARFARSERLRVAVHIAESRAERELVVHGTGDFAAGLRARAIDTPPRARSPIELLARTGVLDTSPLLIHCVDVDSVDIARIGAAACGVAHCPVANAKLGHGLAPLTALLESGAHVGLGTDSVGSNNRLDLLEEARIAALLHRAASGRYDLLPAAQLLRLCTIDGARALGLDDRIGTLEPDKQADLCAISLDSISAVPSYDPVVSVFHAARAADVVLTVVGGEIAYERGVFRTIDVARARAGVLAAAERVAAALLTTSS